MRSSHAGKGAKVSLTKITEIIDSESIFRDRWGKVGKGIYLHISKKEQGRPKV